MFKMPKKIEFVVHYYKDDPECQCDYASVEIKFDKKQVFRAGDAYHDNGWDRAESWLKGFAFGRGEVVPEIIRVNKADIKY